MKQISVQTWDEFKAIVAAKQLLVQYEQQDRGYEVLAPEAGMFIWEIFLLAGTDEYADFESNVKSGANRPLEIKGGIGKPIRVAPSAQPIGTVEHWKGFHHESAQGEASFTFDVGFDTDVYLRGGILYSDDCDHNDHVSVAIVAKADPTQVIVPSILENVYMLKNTTIPFVSAESMHLPSSLMLRATYVKGGNTNERNVSALLDFFK